MFLISTLLRKLIRSKALWREIEVDSVSALPYKTSITKYLDDPEYLRGLQNLKYNKAYQDALGLRISQLYAFLHFTPKSNEYYDKTVLVTLSQIEALKWCKNDLPKLYKEKTNKTEVTV